VVAGAIPSVAGARGSCCVISWHARVDAAAAAGGAQLGRAWVADGIPAAPQPRHAAGPRGKAVSGGGGMDTDPHTWDLLFRRQLGSWVCG